MQDLEIEEWPFEVETVGKKRVYTLEDIVEWPFEDLCNSPDLPEVEIISLIQEEIPRYKLRADTVFGYENKDWLESPALPPDTPVDLSPEQAEETLKYFALCSDRVAQMTKTYNDIEAVTRLLEEKERDLELAAKIGQSLLERNRLLSQKNDYLEEQLQIVSERNNQLQHELQLKEDLLQIYTQEESLSETDSSCTSPATGLIHIDVLQRKIKTLEEENFQIICEAAKLKTETVDYEEQEAKLVSDCVKELSTFQDELKEANTQIKQLTEELVRKNEDNARFQEESTSYLAQTIDLNKKLKKSALENEELQQHLRVAKETQQELTEELRDLEEKYQEVMGMLHEAQAEAKTMRKKTQPSSSTKRPYGSTLPGMFPLDSLASEIEHTMRQQIGDGFEGPSPKDQRTNTKRVMDTVRYIRRKPPPGKPIPGSNTTTTMTSMSNSPLCTNTIGSGSSYTSSPPSENYGADDDENSNVTGTDTTSSKSSNLGRPGIPGSNDLETALRRLSLRREAENIFRDRQRERRISECRESDISETSTPDESDSIMSTGSHLSFLSRGSSFSRPYIPEKLQIVKPMEGSMTLHQWQRLATPNLAGVLESQDGVHIKGYRHIEQDFTEEYHLSDVEEDDGCACLELDTRPNLSKSDAAAMIESNDHDDSTSVLSLTRSLSFTSFLAENLCVVIQPTSGSLSTNTTYTYTQCGILHPSDDNTSVSSRRCRKCSCCERWVRAPCIPGYLKTSGWDLLILGLCQACAISSSSGRPVPSVSMLRSQPPAVGTLRRTSISNSCSNLREATSTFSTNTGLAKLLKERGIQAMKPVKRKPERLNVDLKVSTQTTPSASASSLPRQKLHIDLDLNLPSNASINLKVGAPKPPPTPPNSPTKSAPILGTGGINSATFASKLARAMMMTSPNGNSSTDNSKYDIVNKVKEMDIGSMISTCAITTTTTTTSSLPSGPLPSTVMLGTGYRVSSIASPGPMSALSGNFKIPPSPKAQHHGSVRKNASF
ncbi:trafficking kinesin-binding protein 1-like isoform X10 [Branchiostoma floridae]|uniref:Trafficking kinesin-binding protein 1-like isoform X10 n=1 Tax=Branchiostoma floridae TaxID=7739 RepID=A0A9J7KIS8_BRAFL|nr:trafficking kinesin-binding protein 1-like isoform X10 [Branchiostoma floridae]